MFTNQIFKIGSYCKEALYHPTHRMVKDNQSILGRLWQVSWVIALVVAGLCLNAALNPNVHFIPPAGPTDYIRELFQNCKVFEASCYISLGLFVFYVLCGRSIKLRQWLSEESPSRVLHRRADAVSTQQQVQQQAQSPTGDDDDVQGAGFNKGDRISEGYGDEAEQYDRDT